VQRSEAVGWVVALTVAEVLTLAALVAVAVLLVRARRELSSWEELHVELPQPPAKQAVGLAVRTVMETVDRVRERGLVGGLLVAPIEDFTRWVTEDRAEIVRVAAPDGTVTVLFSDIEDSTALNERLGDDPFVRLLAAHDRAVRTQVARHGGHVVKSQGDGFMVVFGSPTDAVDAARKIQRAVGKEGRRLRRTPVRVRIGIHVGTAVARDGDYFGRNVAKAARVAAIARGGQILASDEVRKALPDTVAVEPAGEHELKGLTGTHVLWAVNP
jgi:class 3 adenylate cyclase